MSTRPLFAISLLCAVVFVAAGCGDEPEPSRQVASDGTLALTVYLPDDAGAGLTGAASDLVEAAGAITGAAVDGTHVSTDRPRGTPRVEVVRVDDDALGDEGYRLSAAPGVVKVRARTDVGAMYGLYAIAADLGARYHHPEESFFPSDPGLQLPDHYAGDVEKPDYAWRGFHEHTQHPIPMSDAYLRPSEVHRAYVSNYIRWLARNRQNAMSWQMLKTVELDAWLPYIEDVISEAHAWGVNVGMVTSFVDQQQNMFRLIREEDLEAEGVTDEEQIRASLAQFVDAGFDFIVTQIGSSEFTKPDDDDVLRWMDVAEEVLTAAGVRYWTWIHTTCDLEAEDGTPFFHLPLRANPNVGAWLHTVMFHNLRDPAPVYGCEDFSHQRAFGDEANGDRSIVYFPETAWWLGFDNNLPLILPITGRSREADIREILPAWDVEGHITFTTGREWTYWQYDHFLTRATWDNDVTWSDYLAWITPMYGTDGERLIDGLQTWTDLQWTHFFEEDPLIYFYLAGELRQDEIGARAGILARRPKLAFADVIAMDDEEFDAWFHGDLRRLRSIHTRFSNVLQYWLRIERGNGEIESAEIFDERPSDRPPLVAELEDALIVYVLRIQHAVRIYETVGVVRTWERTPESERTDRQREQLLDNATYGLALAQEITELASRIFADAESRYRYPVEMLARPKPESLTAYPYGYLEQTSSAHFWTRREDQIEALIARSFGTSADGWDIAPDALYESDADRTTLLVPSDPLAGSVITGFIPRTLFGILGEGDDVALALALDANLNGLPDVGSETWFDAEVTADGLKGTAEAFTLTVYSDAGEAYGELTVFDAALAFELDGDVPTHTDLEGEIFADEMVQLVVSVGGIDAQGAANLVKSVFGYGPAETMPERLPIAFRFELGLLAAPTE